MNKTLAFLLLLPVGLVGCGENNKPVNNSANKPVKGLTIENVSGIYERDVDGMKFKLVIDKSGTFKDCFQYLFEDLSGSTFMEQAGGKCKIVEKEVHFHYESPADFVERGHVAIFRVQQDGGLAVIAAIVNEERHDLSEEQQAESLDWLKRSENVANKGFRIVNPKPRPTVSKEQEDELSSMIESFTEKAGSDTNDSDPDEPSDSQAEDLSEATVPKKEK